MKPAPALATLMAVVLLCPVHPLHAQTLNPAYLSEFPPVQKVMTDMKVADPDETAARQMGTFLQFQKFIKDMADTRWYQHQMTADENALLTKYQTAYNFVAGHKPEYHKFTALKGYDIDPRFQMMLFDKYFSKSFVARYEELDATLKAQIAARATADTQSMMAARAADAAAQQAAAGGGKDQRMVRRCLEAGRNQSTCMASGIGESAKELIGDDAMNMINKLTAPGAVSGMRMGGAYPAPNKSSVGLTFYPGEVLVACQDLVPDPADYKVVTANGQLGIIVSAKPANLQFLVRNDGRLQGTGPVSITGRVQIGVQQGTRTWSNGLTEPISRPVYGTFTRSCNSGVLTTSGPAPKAATALSIGAAAMSLLSGGNTSATAPTDPPGVRLVGEYGSQAGFDLEFTPEGVVVGCKESAVLKPYAVGMAGGQVQLRIQWTPAPLVFVVGADGSLTGSGNVTVNGRIVTDISNDGKGVFQPRPPVSCAVGVVRASN